MSIEREEYCFRDLKESPQLLFPQHGLEGDCHHVTAPPLDLPLFLTSGEAY